MSRFSGFLAVAAALLAMSFTVPAIGDQQEQQTAPYPADIVYSGTGMASAFSHEFHVGTVGYSCDTCHDSIFEMKAYAARDAGDFKMSVMQDGEYCGKCHDGQTAFSVSDYAQCGRCHNGAKDAVEKPGLKVVGPQETIKLGKEGSIAEFRHTSHQAFACNKCHTGLFPVKKTKTITTMDDINSGKACGACHNGAIAFDATNCSSCHPDM
jgi:c(7)-type cytochrome triheme protein